jgi:hypothetical protein
MNKGRVGEDRGSKETDGCVRGHPSSPLLPCPSLCLYVFPMVSIHIRPHLYHSDLLAIIDAPHQYLDIRRFGQLDRNQG